MIMSEHQSKVASIAANTFLLTAVHEHAGIGNEHVVENGQGLYIADLSEGSVETSSLVMLAGQSHQLDAVPVGGQSKGNRIVTVLSIHKLGGQSNDLVHIRSAGVADLSTADNDALGGGTVDIHAVHIGINNVEELVGIGLHMCSLVLGVTGTLYVGLGAVADQVLLLAVLDVLLETGMILGAASLVAVVGDGEQSVQCVRAHAALHTSANAMADQTGHELLLQQVLYRLVNVGGTVVNGAVRLFYHADITVIGIICGVVALLHDIGTADNPVSQIALSAGLAVGTVDLLAVEVDVGLHVQKPLFVLLVSANCHLRYTSKTFFIGEFPDFLGKTAGTGETPAAFPGVLTDQAALFYTADTLLRKETAPGRMGKSHPAGTVCKLVDGHAAVYGDQHAGDIAACGRSQECNHVGNLDGLCITAQRNHAGNSSHVLLVSHNVLGHVGENIAGSNSVNGNAEASQLVGHDPGQVCNSSLQGAVNGVANGALDAGSGGQVDDAVGMRALLAALSLHLAGNSLAHEIQSLVVGLYVMVEVILVHIYHLSGLSASTSVVDQNVDVAESLNGLVYQVLTSLSRGNVGSNAQSLAAGSLDFLSNLVAGLLLTAGDNNSCTVVSHQLCDCIADAAGRTGDDSNLTGQIIHAHIHNDYPPYHLISRKAQNISAYRHIIVYHFAFRNMNP